MSVCVWKLGSPISKCSSHRCMCTCSQSAGSWGSREVGKKGSRISWLQLYGTGMKACEGCRYFRQFHWDFLLEWRHKETLLLSVLHSQVLNHFISELNLNLITVNLLDWLSLCFLSEELKSECQRSAHEDFPAEKNTSPFPPPFLCCWGEGTSSWPFLPNKSVVCTLLFSDCTVSLGWSYILVMFAPPLNKAFYSGNTCH